MSKFKVGDKVKRVSSVDIFIERTGSDSGVITGVDGDGFISFNHTPTIIWNYGCFEMVDEWTIHNNTKPLIELSDEQVGKLVKHSGEVEHINPNNGVWNTVNNPMWNRGGIYRAKQNTERELFIDAAMAHYDHKTVDGHTIAMLGRMFDAGFKAPKLGG